MSGILSAVSGPIGIPMRPPAAPASANDRHSSETPSSSGRGDGQLLMSFSQVADISGTPISGTTAIGFPDDGTTRNHGRLDLPEGREETAEIPHLGFRAKQQRVDPALRHQPLCPCGTPFELRLGKSTSRNLCHRPSSISTSATQ